MLTLHSFLHAVFFFVKEMHRTSSVLMTGMMIVAVVAFSANGFGGSGKNALAAPIIEEMEEEAEEEETEGSSLVTEAKIQFGLFDTDSEGQQFAGALLEKSIREKQKRQAAAQTEIEALQKQILKEKQEEESRRK